MNSVSQLRKCCASAPGGMADILAENKGRFLQDTSKWKWIALRSQENAKQPKSCRTKNAPQKEIILTLHGAYEHERHGGSHKMDPVTVVLLENSDCIEKQETGGKETYLQLRLRLINKDYLTYHIEPSSQKEGVCDAELQNVKSGNSSRLILDAWEQFAERQEDKMCWALLKSIITTTLLEILQKIDQKPSRHRQIVISIENYISKHLSEHLSLDSLASVAGYSPFFFHRLFVEHTGYTPREYINFLRLEKAKELLKQGFTIESISEQIGIASVSYFSRLFKKHMRYSPKLWSTLDRK